MSLLRPPPAPRPTRAAPRRLPAPTTTLPPDTPPLAVVDLPMIPLDGMVDPAETGVFALPRRPPPPELAGIAAAAPSLAWPKAPPAAAPLAPPPFVPVRPPSIAALRVAAVLAGVAVSVATTLFTAVACLYVLTPDPPPPAPPPPAPVVDDTPIDDEGPEPPPIAAPPVVGRPAQRTPVAPPAAPAAPARPGSVRIALEAGSPAFTTLSLGCDDGYRQQARFVAGVAQLDDVPGGARCRAQFRGGPFANPVSLSAGADLTCAFAGATPTCR